MKKKKKRKKIVVVFFWQNRRIMPDHRGMTFAQQQQGSPFTSDLVCTNSWQSPCSSCCRAWSSGASHGFYLKYLDREEKPYKNPKSPQIKVSSVNSRWGPWGLLSLKLIILILYSENSEFWLFSIILNSQNEQTNHPNMDIHTLYYQTRRSNYTQRTGCSALRNCNIPSCLFTPLIFAWSYYYQPMLHMLKHQIKAVTHLNTKFGHILKHSSSHYSSHMW